MTSEQNLFERLVSLVGKPVEVKTISSAIPLNGVIANTMFDSFILTTNNASHIIAFTSLLYIKPLAN